MPIKFCFANSLSHLARLTLALLLTAASNSAIATADNDLGQAGLRVLERWEALLLQLPLLGIALLIMLLFYLLSRWVGRWEQPFSRLWPNRFVQNMARQITQLVIFLVGVLMALEVMDATALVGAVLGAAGVVGLAIGFAFRDVVENYLAGILLSLRQPFRPNDHIKIDAFEGKVIRLTSRATIILSFDGNHIRLPNATVFKSNMINFSRNPLRRFDFAVGVGTEEDLHAAQDIGTQTLQNMESVLDEPAAFALLDEPGDSSIGVHFYAWVDQTQTNYSKSKSEAIRLVTAALTEAEIDMPEPIHRVRVEQLVNAGNLVGQVAETQVNAPIEEEPKPVTEGEQDTRAGDHIDEQIAKERIKEGDDLLDASAPVE